MTPNTQGDTWKPEFETWYENNYKNFYELTNYIERLLSKERAEGYEEGQKNPVVGFLRQYLNERPVMSDGRLWTDEDILRFLRIPFVTLPADSTEEKCTKTYCDCAEHWGKPNKCVDMDCVCDTHDSTEETNNHD